MLAFPTELLLLSGQAQPVCWANKSWRLCLTLMSQTFANHLHTGISRVLRLLLLPSSLCRCVVLFLRSLDITFLSVQSSSSVFLNTIIPSSFYS